MIHQRRLAAVMLSVAALSLSGPSVAFASGASTEASPSVRAAYTGTITGTVTDSRTGQPLAGAQISVVGTTVGAATDAAGKYRIPAVAAGNVNLRVRFIGYAPMDRSVLVTDGQTVTADFQMEVKPLSLDAMVVTGTAGGTKAREVGNAISQLSMTKTTETPSLNVQQLLGQRATSVVVMPVAGNVGSGSQINIRGAASLSLNTQPIIYVDGVRVDNSTAEGPAIRQGRSASRLNDFNPEDIESIEIIKGPAAATLYGTEASNGVIQILTKRGKTGAPKLDVTIRGGGNWFADKRAKLGVVYGRNPTTQLVDSFSVFDLYKQQNGGQELFTFGPLKTLNVSLSGGNDAAKYFASGEVSRTRGIVDYNWSNLASARVNLALLPSATWKFNANMNFNQSETRFAQAADQFGIWEMMIWASPTLLSATTQGWRYATPATAASVDSRAVINRFTGGVDATNSPFTWLTQQFKAGLDISSAGNQVYFPKVPAGAINLQGARVGGEKTLEAVTVPYLTLDYSATAKKDFGSFTTSTSVGAQYYRKSTTTVSAVGSNFPTPDISTIGGAAATVAGETYVENKTLGFYFQESVGSHNRRFLTAAVRGDANSAFGKDYKAAYYPKLSGTWVLSEEPFFGNWKYADQVGSLRLRASWGQAGQQPDAFAALKLYTPITGPGAAPAASPSSIGNPALKPERGTELDFGFDLAFKDDRITVEYTHYARKTTDGIVNVPVKPATGFPGNQIINLGQTRNWGDELAVNFKMLSRENLGWDLGVNFATTKNMVDDLGGVTLQAYRVGYPITSIFMARVVSASFDASGKVANVLCEGLPGKPPTTCDVAPLVDWGVGQPTKSGNISNTLTLWKSLRLMATVEYQLGHHSISGDIRDANTNFQNSAKIWTGAPDAIFAAYQSVAPKAPLGYYDASWMKLRELSANYTMSPKYAHMLRAQSASLTAAWRNVYLLWSKTKRVNSVLVPDPEVRSPGLGNSATYQTTIPPTSSAILTVRLSY